MKPAHASLKRAAQENCEGDFGEHLGASLGNLGFPEVSWGGPLACLGLVFGFPGFSKRPRAYSVLVFYRNL